MEGRWWRFRKNLRTQTKMTEGRPQLGSATSFDEGCCFPEPTALLAPCTCQCACGAALPGPADVAWDRHDPVTVARSGSQSMPCSSTGQMVSVEGAWDLDGLEESAPTGTGRYWTAQEHQRFLEAAHMYGLKNAKAISHHVGTRSPTQVRTHLQKYLLKLQRERKKRHYLSDDRPGHLGYHIARRITGYRGPAGYHYSTEAGLNSKILFSHSNTSLQKESWVARKRFEPESDSCAVVSPTTPFLPSVPLELRMQHDYIEHENFMVNQSRIALARDLVPDSDRQSHNAGDAMPSTTSWEDQWEGNIEALLSP